MSTRLEATLSELLDPVITGAGYDCEELRVIKAGKRRVLRLLIDSDRGVVLDDVANLSRAISAVLDEQQLMGQAPYTLEVSSPGVARPLTLSRHWRRNQGRLVRVRFVDDRPAVLGRILESRENQAVVGVDGEPVAVSYAEVASAVVQVEFK